MTLEDKMELKIESSDRVKCAILIIEFSINSSSNYSWELWLIIRLEITEYLLVLEY